MCFGEYYRLVNHSTKLYLDYHENNGKRLPFGNTRKGTPIQFKDGDKKVTAGPVPAKAMVNIEFFYPEKDPLSRGYLWGTQVDGSSRYLALDGSLAESLMFNPVK